MVCFSMHITQCSNLTIALLEHQNWIGIDEKQGPFIISVRKENNPNNPDSKLIRVLLRTRRGDDRKCVQQKLVTSKAAKLNKSATINDIMKVIDPTLNRQKIKLIKDPSIVEDLKKFEECQLVKSYKFGILFCKEGQTREEEMFSNGSFSHSL